MRFSIVPILVYILFLSEMTNPQSISSDLFPPDSGIDSTGKNMNVFLLGASFLYGYMIPHAKEVIPVRGLNPRGHELMFNWHLINDEVWSDCECYPRFGTFLSYYDFDQEELLGYGFSAGLMFTYFLSMPDEFNFHLKGRGGISYLSNPFDKNKQPVNWSYSTHFNYILGLGGGITYRPVDIIEFQLDGSLNHQSNAALLEPNGGINYWALSLTTNYFLDSPEFRFRKIRDPYFSSEKKTRWDISFSWGISSMPYPLPGQVPMYGITILRSIQLWRIFAATFALELERNGRAAELSRRKYAPETTNPYRGSVLLGGEFLMGRTILSAQLGAYLYRSFKEHDDVYQRWGVTYNLIDDFYVGLNFKSYRNSADHLSFRLTYSFK